MVPCFPLLGLTPSGLFMGLSSTIIYTSELILWFHYLCSQCYAAQHSYVVIFVYHAFLFTSSSTPQLIIADLLVWSRCGIMIFMPCCVLPDLALSVWSVVFDLRLFYTFCLIWHGRFDRTYFGPNCFYAVFDILLCFA